MCFDYEVEKWTNNFYKFRIHQFYKAYFFENVDG